MRPKRVWLHAFRTRVRGCELTRGRDVRSLVDMIAMYTCGIPEEMLLSDWSTCEQTQPYIIRVEKVSKVEGAR